MRITLQGWRGAVLGERDPNGVAHHLHELHRRYLPIALQVFCKAAGTSVHHGCACYVPKRQCNVFKLRAQLESSHRAIGEGKSC